MKKIISVITIFALLLSMTTLTSFASATTATENVLVGGTATSTNMRIDASYAIDGVTTLSGNNYWRTWGNSTTYVLDISLTEAKTFDKVSVLIVSETFANALTTGSTITVSAGNDSNFSDAETLTTIDASGALEYSAVFAATTAQYVRFTFTSPATNTTGVGILEVGAYNSGEGSVVDPSTKINVFEDATAYAESARFSADFAVDGVTTLSDSGDNYWRTYTNRSSYAIDLTLSEEKTFDKVEVQMVSSYFWAKWSSGCKIYVSTSKDAEFTNTKTVSVTEMSGVENYTIVFPAVTAKYVRITFNSEDANELGVLEISGYNSGEGFKTENNESKNGNYIIIGSKIEDGKYTMQAMATDYYAAKTLTAIVAQYSDAECSRLSSVDVLDAQTVKFNEITDISFDVGTLTENYRILLWENLTGLQPVLEQK